MLTNKFSQAFCSRILLKSVVGLAACNCVGCFRDSSHRYQPQRFSRQAQSSVVNALRTQHAVGQDLNNTVWNYHFDEFTADLNQLGRNHLARYVRQSANCPQQLFLQTAYDVRAYDPKTKKDVIIRQDNVDEFLKYRSKLDSKRIAALNEYLLKMYQIPPSEIAILDPAPSSIHSEELMRSQRKMVRNVEGFLPRETIRSEFRFGGGESMDFGGGGLDFGGSDPSLLTPEQPQSVVQQPFGTDGGTPGFGSEIPTTPEATSGPAAETSFPE